jgi:hypothetical protein
MENLSLTLTENPSGLSISLNNQTIPLPPGRAEKTLSDIFLHMRAGLSAERIAFHLTYHTIADHSCPCCKLEGRVLAAKGRRAPPVQNTQIHLGGRTIVRHPTGASGAQILAAQRRAALYTTPPKSTVVARCKKRIEDMI